MTQIVIISASIGGVFVLVLCTILTRKLCKRHTFSIDAPVHSCRAANHSEVMSLSGCRRRKVTPDSKYGAGGSPAISPVSSGKDSPGEPGQAWFPAVSGVEEEEEDTDEEGGEGQDQDQVSPAPFAPAEEGRLEAVEH